MNSGDDASTPPARPAVPLRPRPKHIGVVAVSPEGSSLLYRDIFRVAGELVGDTGHPRVSLHNEPLELYLAAIERGDWLEVGELLLSSAKKLASLGAEVVVAPDNLMQHAVQLIEAKTPVPWLKMPNVVADAIIRDRKTSVGLIGTKLVMFSSVYQTLLGMRGIKVIAPEVADAEMIDDVIFDELVHGLVKPKSRVSWIAAIDRLKHRGCQGVILGCTEAPLLLNATDSPLPVYDSTALLAEAVVRDALIEAQPQA